MKVLSTTTRAPASWAAAMIAGTSATSRAGLVGDSNHTSAASSQAATTSSVSVMSTSVVVSRPRSSRSARLTSVPL